ncbi:LacI family transcriptional regulator [Devosia pacifica]|uniref:LacI family transcriptional regulator n=1 Tax=Devosia pacifica TaxID=1335967 RepID=A0A918S7X0_9HYPH|nr:XRE family transcriptional regulator [Devosia pacifica]GHA27880.1 LacI family transcriptional regulator [Devosia pacifica]
MDTIEDNQDARLGERIRIERHARGWSLAELAARSGVSKAMIHKIERGDSSPTAALLMKLSGAFSLSMSRLIARAELAPSGLLLRETDQPRWRDPQSGYVRRQVSPISDMPVDLVRVELPAGATVSAPAASYAFIRQLIWVLQGQLVFCEGETRHVLDSGDCLELGPPQDCVFRNESDAPCTYAVVVLQTK